MRNGGHRRNWLIGVAVTAMATVLPVVVPGTSASATASDVSPFTTVDQFVMQQVRDLHGRDAAGGEITIYGGKLSDGSATAADIVGQVADAPKGAEVIEPVIRLYLAYFLRNPEAGGLDYWVKKARGGTTIQTISSNFAGSSEFKNRYGSLSNTAFVNLVYQNVLGRAGDPGGVAYWIKKLDLKRLSRGQVMAQFSESSEYKRKSADKVTTVLYLWAMLRKISTGPVFAARLTVVVDEGRAGLITDLLADPAYAARFPRPGAPGPVTGVVDDKKVVLTWGPAAATSPAILGYRIRAYSGPTLVATKTTAPTATKFTFEPLSNGTAYTFTVTAYNTNGDGPGTTSEPLTPIELANWVGYQGSATHEGIQTAGALPDQPTKKWTKAFDDIVSYPVVARDRVFVIVRAANAAGDYGGRLYALDADDGHTLWGPVAIGGTYYRQGLAWEDGRVFTLNVDGQMASFDEVTGSKLWSRNLTPQYRFGSAPTVRNGVVYAQGAGSGTTLYAVDAKTGAIKWSRAGTESMSTASVTATGIYASESCGATAWTLTGTVQWTASDSCDDSGGATSPVHDGRMYARAPFAGGDAAILDLSNGHPVGTFPRGSAAPAFDGSRGFVNASGGLTAFDAATGDELWNQAPVSGTVDLAPVVADGRVYIVGSNGDLEGFDAITGASEWTGDAGFDTDSVDEWNYSGPLVGMALGDDHLYVPAGTHLVAFG